MERDKCLFTVFNEQDCVKMDIYAVDHDADMIKTEFLVYDWYRRKWQWIPAEICTPDDGRPR